MSRRLILPYAFMSAICLASAGSLTSCSSGSKKEEPAKAPSQQAAVESSGETPEVEEGSSSAAQAPGAQKPAEPMAAPVKNASLDPKYKALGQALRPGATGDTADVSGASKEAIKILSTNQNDPVALNTLALIELKRGKSGAAKLLLGRALEKNAPTASLHNNMAVALLEEGDQAGAIVELKKALRIDDHNAEALGNLGSLYIQGGDYVRAKPLLEQSYQQNKTNLAVANNYAIALRGVKDYEGARKVYEGILKADSRNVLATLNCAILLIDFMNKPKDGLDLVYRLKFLETEKKDIVSRANALEKKAKSELK
jgi:Flp pilus assembly protein TadD